MKWRVRREENHYADTSDEEILGGVWWIVEPDSWFSKSPIGLLFASSHHYRPHTNKHEAIEECRKLNTGRYK